MMEASLKRKKKICKSCKRESYIWSGGKCRFCAEKDKPKKKKRNYKKKLKRKRLRKAGKTDRQKKIAAIDRDFSLLVRAIAAVKGIVECYTCGHKMKWKGGGAQCGHFQGRSKMCLRWDLENSRVQDANCNVGLSGNLEVYEAKLREEKGDEFVDDLILRGKQTCKYTLNDLETIHQEIKKQLKAVLKEKNL